MKTLLIAALLSTCVAVTGPLTVCAAENPPEKPVDGNKGRRPAGQPFRGTIKSFDKASQTLTLEGVAYVEGTQTDKKRLQVFIDFVNSLKYRAYPSAMVGDE